VKKLKLNSKLTVPLILVVLSIWAIIIYNVINYFNSFDKEDTASAALTDNFPARVITNKYRTADIDTLSYTAPGKSPFVLGTRIEEKPPAPKPAVNLPKVKEPPPLPKLNYKITGIIISGGNKLAVLEDVTNSKTVFLHEGESYLHLHIKLIETEKVSLLEDKTLKEIVVPR
jgi:hypothetical protein